jgi:ATP/maltotriose-dependent transcriptional regulator MalT
VLERLRFRTSALWSTIVARLGAAFASIKRRSVIVLDDVHLLHRRDCLDIVAALCAYVPDGSQLVLAGRAEPQLGVTRVRAERRPAEGWAAGLHLSALSPRERRSVDREAVSSVSAQEGHVADTYGIIVFFEDRWIAEVDKALHMHTLWPITTSAVRAHEVEKPLAGDA